MGALDQGTTSTRFVVVDDSGRFVATSQMEHEQIFPQPGWVEHDPLEIWRNTETVITNALAKAGIAAKDLTAVGITNQRETTMVWDAATGEPIANAIVWQDTRTDRLVADIGGLIGPDRFRTETGLPLATYFAGPKARWLLDTVQGARARGEAGELLFGTMDSWVIWKLTGEHVTDVTNASRTLLMNLSTLDWDDELLDAIGVPAAMLPEIRPSIGSFGTTTGVLEGVEILGVLGDQQAAMFGQAAFNRGDAKNTYGTGCFMLVNTGTAQVASEHGLLTTVAYQWGGNPASYALEGSIAIAGAGVQWLRDNLGIIDSAPEVEALASRAPDNGGVYFVPAFSGLFAPYWRSDARGVIAGLSRHSDASHLARATLEAVAYQSRDVLQAMEADAGVTLASLKVDGGMVANELLMQFQADILDVPVVRPVVTETTVLGAAYAAGLASGVWSGFEELASQWAEDRRFEPAMAPELRRQLYADWQKAVERTFGWVD
ncbi:MAG: glycerol kinase GlpK [Acidimicrobiia bacterium]|nr:glycerol kinase GlpK [Acidimicrobiia bacterium]